MVKRAISTLLLVGILEGCGAGGPQAVAPEDAVRARAEARWEAVIAGDYAAAYRLLSPGYRSGVSLVGYNGRFANTRWLEAQVQEVTCEPEVCDAQVVAKYRFLGVPPIPASDGETRVAEKWILVDGEWWHVPRR